MDMNLELWQWLFGATAGWLVGLSKTGVPGLGILVVPLLAAAFGGWASVGIMLPMLLFGDCFAVAWYRRHAEWDKLVGLLPWVAVGMAIGSGALWLVGRLRGDKDVLSIAIGAIVLIMLGLHLVQRRSGYHIAPHRLPVVVSVGAAAGFATTVSNAAGPIMSIYLMAHRLGKREFMGTSAWFYLVINLIKLPVYFALSAANPLRPIIGAGSLLLVLAVSPAILTGVMLGKWLLPRFPQRAFDSVVLALSGISAAYLIVRQLW